MKETTFYMLYMDGGGAPTYKHGDYESAEKEAKRLAERYGKKVYILNAFTSVELQKFSITPLAPPHSIPF